VWVVKTVTMACTGGSYDAFGAAKAPPAFFGVRKWSPLAHS
jgi:hypothetical protein